MLSEVTKAALRRTACLGVCAGAPVGAAVAAALSAHRAAETVTRTLALTWTWTPNGLRRQAYTEPWH
jgi:hypothetical protein